MDSYPRRWEGQGQIWLDQWRKAALLLLKGGGLHKAYEVQVSPEAPAKAGP